MNVRQAWLNSDSIRDCWMSNEFVKMQFILHEQNIKIIPVYIRSAQHLHADLISRNKVMPDCHLDGSIAQKIFQLLGQYEVDIKATSNSHQAKVYFSTHQNNEAAALHASTENWSRFRLAYIFPPLVMMELIPNKIYQC